MHCPSIRASHSVVSVFIIQSFGAIYSPWLWGRLRTSTLPIEEVLETSAFRYVLCDWKRTLNNAEAAAGLAVGILVGVDGSITLHEDLRTAVSNMFSI